MVNASLAGIIAAICAASGAFLGTLATVLYNRHNDIQKRRREERDIVGRYRDALLHACEELHSPLRSLCDGSFPQKFHGHGTKLDSETALKSYDYCYFIYGIGRLFCWIYIIQNDIRNIHHKPTDQDHLIMNIFYSISRVLSDQEALSLVGSAEMQSAPFQIQKGFQASIGEKMSIGEPKGCMGYATFWSQWMLSSSHSVTSDKEAPFKIWFDQVEQGIHDLKNGPRFLSPLHKISRIRKFQHLLVDLSEALDPDNKRIHHHGRIRWQSKQFLPPVPPFDCYCTVCSLSLIGIGANKYPGECSV